MSRGRKPQPTALRRAAGNPGKRAWNHDEPVPPEGTPDCPPHLAGEARTEWFRLVDTLVGMGVVTVVDRGALAADCQAWGRWVEAEEKLKATPLLLKTPSGYVQQSPWLTVVNRQMELMGRFMAELGITPASRSRIVVAAQAQAEAERITRIERVIVYKGTEGLFYEKPLDGEGQEVRHDPASEPVSTLYLDADL